MDAHTRIALSVIALLVVGCGTPAGRPPPASQTSGYDGEWWLVTGFGPDGKVTVPRGYEATMTIEGNTISGVAVCNHYSGEVEIAGNSFRATAGEMTEMGCPGAAGEGEQAFISALLDATRIDRHDAELILDGGSSELRFSFHQPPPVPELAGTRWKLNGLIEGRGSYGSVRSPTRAVLVFEKDGTLRGTTGCRRFSARWATNGEGIEVSELTARGSCAPSDDLAQDERILEVLDGTITARIKEQSLEIFRVGSELGLSYTTGLR